MPGLLSGFAQGLANASQSQGSNNGQMTEYQAARLDQQQQSTDANVARAQSSQSLNEAREVGVEAKNRELQKDAEFNAGVEQAAAAGGFAAAIDYAQKKGKFEWAAARIKEQQDLNNSIAQGMKLSANADEAQIKTYNEKMKALGGLSAVFFKDVATGLDPAQTYEKYKPVFKEIWKDAPDKYDEKTENYLKIALSQQLQQNTNYARTSQAGKLLNERKLAMQAGDTEAVRVYDAQLQKLSMFVNPQTGDVINLLGSAPDDHKGSVDSKAAIVGLSAGSTIPPVPGAVFQQQPMNNFMDAEYAKYDQDNKIDPQTRTIKNMKVPQGYNLQVHPDGTTSLQSIAGGPADKPKLSASESVRVSSLQTGQKAVNEYVDLLIDPKTNQVKEDIAGIFMGKLAQAQRIGSTDSQTINNIINRFTSPEAKKIKTIQDNIIEGILRGQSGATINAAERPRFEQELLPQPGDDPETIKVKLKMTHEILNGSLQILKNGMTGKPVVDKEGNGQVDWNALMKAKDYALHGGDILDITRGDGADPEKARQAELKKLSYDPKQVAFYKDPANNGQGRALSDEEARQLIDQIQQAQQKKGGQ